jgi:hypothetical protein
MAVTLRELAAAAGVRLRQTRSLDLVPSVEADRFLSALEAASVRVWGAEGFWVGENEIRPNSEAILDLSSLQDWPESISEARQFVRDVAAPDLWIHFTVDGDAPRP